MNKIKILYIGLSPNLGGIETYLYNLYKNMDKSKFEVSFLVFKGKKVCFYDELKAEGVKFFEITHRNKNYRQFLKDLKEVYSNNQFDYIHQNLMNYSCFERITYAHKYSNAKIIIHSHTAGHGKAVGLKTRILHFIGRLKIKNIPILRVACSDAAGKMMFGKKKFKIFNNGIDVDKFRYDINNRTDIRKELNIDDKTFVLGLIGMFETVKNHKFLLNIFSEYIKNNKNSKLLLVGEGRLKKDIEELSKTLNIEKNVLFIGKRLDVWKVYSAMDVYVMPSLYEGISIALIEAQANGLKCYTSDGVDVKSDLTGNVRFLSLNHKPSEWASFIYNCDNNRDEDVISKFPKEFLSKKTCEEVYKFYKDNYTNIFDEK